MEMEMALGPPISTPDEPKDWQKMMDFDIEQPLRDFVDEPPIRHNVCPDADNDDPEWNPVNL